MAPAAHAVTGTRRSALRKESAPIKARVAQLRSFTGVPSPLGNAAAASGAQSKTPASALLPDAEAVTTPLAEGCGPADGAVDVARLQVCAAQEILGAW